MTIARLAARADSLPGCRFGPHGAARAPLPPRNIQDVTKLSAEQLCRLFLPYPALHARLGFVRRTGFAERPRELALVKDETLTRNEDYAPARRPLRH